ncbi:Integral membrane protein [hydrothermal vent metagenome]|uniref:Integral membrane protein n=1 Tax=hydrothermal vent metagenome TaxID=652676 RepID=A0A3B0TUQ9_9ZZZZ
MSEDLDQNNSTSSEELKESGEEVKKDFKGLLASTKEFLVELLDIRKNTDQEATKEAIIANIAFKGHTSWILICSIFIASVGLNANATAVVIGAMLISPIMGPILGIGMSLAINDIDTLRRSIKNFTVMVVLSVLTAYLFFEFFPLQNESSELLSRTKPDIRDVLIAFFGGLALVIARAKKGSMASVIFGVAIATALIPPLCTVGFGIAIRNWDYAWGALYLFTINTIFIALATFLVLKLLRFPMVRYVNSQKRTLVARSASLLAVAVMIPAGFTFYDVFKESLFRNQAKEFIDEKIAPYQFSGGGRFLEDFTDVEYNDGENPSIELVFMGNEIIPDNVIATWNTQKDEGFPRLKNVELLIIQGSKNEELDQFKYVNELYESQKNQLLGKDEKIRLLETELIRLRKSAGKQIPFQDISAEARVNYDNLVSLGFAHYIKTDFKKIDTIPVFEVTWKRDAKMFKTEADTKKLLNWLKLRLKDSTIRLREIAQD